MKCSVLILLFALSMPLAAQNPFGEKPKPVPVQPEEIYNDLEEMPVFPGGPEAMQKYLVEHLNFPADIRRACSGHKLVAGFVVEKDGSLSKIDIIKEIKGCPDFDFDLRRVIKNMPKWIPGRLKGVSVRCYYKMPVYIG